jgi:hypothetical protein
VRLLTIIFFTLLIATNSFAQVATIVRLSGHVEILSHPSKAENQNGPKILYDNDYYLVTKPRVGLRLQDGIIIKTGSDSKFSMIYQNGDMVTVGESSFYKVLPKSRTDGKSVTELLQGVVRTTVAKDGPNSGMEVRAGTSAMGVRGTDFVVSRPGKASDAELVVLRGEVAVGKKSGTAISKPQSVKAGQMAEMSQKQIQNVKKPSEQIAVRLADKETLGTVQVETSPSPSNLNALKATNPEEKKLAESIEALEAKAATNILKDIKIENPVLYKKLTEENKGQIDTFTLNTSTVETAFLKAPVPEAIKSNPNAKQIAAIDPNILFSKTQPPAAPMLRFPVENGVVEDTDASFKWDLDPNVQTYQIQISANEKFASVLRSEETTTPSKSIALPTGSYWWRVRGSDKLNRYGSWSESQTFTFKTVEKKEDLLTKIDDPVDKNPVASFSFIFGPSPYDYQFSNAGRKTNAKGESMTTALNISYRFSRPLRFEAEAGKRSLDNFSKDFGGGSKKAAESATFLSIGTSYQFFLSETFALGSGIGFIQTTTPHVGATSEKHDYHKVESALVSASANYESNANEILMKLSYAVINGSETIDLKNDKSTIADLNYRRFLRSIPLTIGLGVRSSSSAYSFRSKGDDSFSDAKMETLSLLLNAGYYL